MVKLISKKITYLKYHLRKIKHTGLSLRARRILFKSIYIQIIFIHASPFSQNINYIETSSNLHDTSSQNKYMELEELQKEKIIRNC